MILFGNEIALKGGFRSTFGLCAATVTLTVRLPFVGGNQCLSPPFGKEDQFANLIKMNEMIVDKKKEMGNQRFSPNDVIRMKSMIIDDFATLLRQSPEDGWHWEGTKCDLIELAHAVWETGKILDERCQPIGFHELVRRIFTVLNIVPPKHPSGVLEKVRQRKNIRVSPIHERYMLLYTVQHIPDPLKLDTKRRHRHRM